MSLETPPKEIIAQRYRLIEQIGKGGMGSVWRAEHVSLKTPVAVKLLNSKLANDATLRARFLREAQASAALASKHIVRILDHGVDDDLPYIAMDFLRGESLRARLRRENVLSPAAAGKVLAGVANGIARAHRAGIVHRDLKPDNIFLAQDDEHGEVVKLVDFGIAKLLDDAKSEDLESIATETGAVLGTPYYMSPEQLRGKKEIDVRSDLWAIGVIAFECLTGKRPFVAEVIGDLVLKICADPAPVPSSITSVPEGFDAWFLRAVAVDLDVRFQTIQELAKELAPVLTPGETWLPDAGPPPTSRPSVPTPVRMSRSGASAKSVDFDTQRNIQTGTAAPHSISSVSGKRGRRPVVYAGGAVLVLALGGGAFFLRDRGGGDSPTGSSQTATPQAPTTSSAKPVVSPAASAAADASAAGPSSSAAPDASVSITFESKPPGAEVVRDGKKLGLAPGPLSFEKTGKEILITIRKAGYLPRDVKVVTDADKKVEVELVRVKRPSDVLD